MISQIISIALHRCNCTADNFNCNGNHFTDHNYGEFQWGTLKWSQWNIVTGQIFQAVKFNVFEPV